MYNLQKTIRYGFWLIFEVIALCVGMIYSTRTVRAEPEVQQPARKVTEVVTEKWVNTSAEENVKIFFINEIRLYNETESAPTLAKQINARSVEIRSEAIKTLGKLKYKEVEPKLIEMYNVQPEEVKRQIITAIADLKTDKALV